MSTLSDFHFLRPLALLLLLVLPLFPVFWRRVGGGSGAWTGVVDAHLLPYLLERVEDRGGRGGLLLAMAAWALAAFALAGPAWEREPMPLYHNQAARVLALELAPSMYAQDEKPNRLARARFKLEDILARSRDYQTALIGYAGDAFVAAPLTDDVNTVRNLIDALDPSTMPLAGNDAARAIEAGAELIEQAGLHRGEIVLLADGVDERAVQAARHARANGITVSVLGIGSAAGAPVPLPQGDFLKDGDGNLVLARVDASMLHALAQAGGGRYAALSADGRDLDALLHDEVDAGDSVQMDGQTAESERWRDRGAWLLLALLPLAALGFRRGWMMVLALVVALPTQEASAFSLSDLWLRADQQASRALEQGDAERAKAVAPTPEWRGGANYRAGDYAAALHEYEQAQGAQGAYNKGNALAKLGRYDEAINAYDDALEQSPGMEDAKANRDAVAAFLKQQEQDKDGSGDKNDKKNQGDKDQSTPSSGQQSGQGGDQSQGEPSQSSPSQDAKSSGDTPQKDDSAKQDDPSRQPSGNGEDDKDKDGASQQQEARQPDAAEQQALSSEIDRQLAEGRHAETGKDDERAQASAAEPAEEDDATREKRQVLEHWLERVPDDPGGLLRRKFQLEYQRRQQREGDSR